jgi:hypothetical protein
VFDSIGFTLYVLRSEDSKIPQQDPQQLLIVVVISQEVKDQDHYRVLGLTKLRSAATDEQEILLFFSLHFHSFILF